MSGNQDLNIYNTRIRFFAPLIHLSVTSLSKGLAHGARKAWGMKLAPKPIVRENEYL